MCRCLNAQKQNVKCTIIRSRLVLKYIPLTLFCKEGMNSARVKVLYVASCQNENKVQQQQKKRALLQTSHISCTQTQSSGKLS